MLIAILCLALLAVVASLLCYDAIRVHAQDNITRADYLAQVLAEQTKERETLYKEIVDKIRAIHANVMPRHTVPTSEDLSGMGPMHYRPIDSVSITMCGRPVVNEGKYTTSPIAVTCNGCKEAFQSMLHMQEQVEQGKRA